MQKVHCQGKSPNKRPQPAKRAYETFLLTKQSKYASTTAVSCTRDTDRSDVPASHRPVLSLFAFVENVYTVALWTLRTSQVPALFAAFSLPCLTGHA